jgi:hypothetical protein
MNMTSHSDLVSGMWADECAGCCASAASIAHRYNCTRWVPGKDASLRITKVLWRDALALQYPQLIVPEIVGGDNEMVNMPTRLHDRNYTFAYLDAAKTSSTIRPHEPR